MLNRFALTVATVALLSAAPAFANGVHGEKGASRNGDSPQVFISDTGATLDGTPIAYYSEFGVASELFEIPSNFTANTSYLLTFNSALSSTASYGIFYCDNGNLPAVDASEAPMTNGTDCTEAAADTNEPFVTFSDAVGGKTATITFAPGTGAPGTFWFWTTGTENADATVFSGNLVSIAPTGATGTMPEPGTYVMLATGLLAVAFMRRRTANNLA